jgi:hypothetical protein
MPDVTREQIKSKLIQSIEPAVSQIIDDRVSSTLANSSIVKRLNLIENYNFSKNQITSDSFSVIDYKNSFIWGLSTWGIDTVGKNLEIVEGEYNSSTRTGVIKREEFRQ